MAVAQDHTGRRFGHLVAEERIGSKRGHAIWRCRCDCGNTSEVLAWLLVQGKSTSCGCHDGLTSIERFWSRTTAAHNGKGCITWTGFRRPDGYGEFSVDGEVVRAHRWICEQVNGAVAAGLVVMHSCDEPSCVNPEHLSPGTTGENTADSIDKGRQRWQKQTHCKNGHELDGDNLYVDPSGRRNCRTCRLAASRDRNDRNRKGAPVPARGNRYGVARWRR
jgi:hypothetical protein